jgi:hypothetical protein
MPPEVNPYPRCANEFMTVGNVTLCGVNHGQHCMTLINIYLLCIKLFSLFIFIPFHV